MYRDPITVDDVMSSRSVAGAVAQARLLRDLRRRLLRDHDHRRRARDLPHRPVYVRGAAGGTTHHSIAAMPDMTRTAAAVSGPKAFADAGITTADVDMLAMYDSFTYTVLVVLEDLGFAPKGEGGAFVADNGGKPPARRRAPDQHRRRRPFGDPSRHAAACFCCARRRASCAGEAGDSQVAGAEIAVAHGSGGWLSTQGTVVLGTEGN